MRPASRSGSRRGGRSKLLSGAAIALVAVSVSSFSACIRRGYPLAQAGQVDIRTDIAGSLFAAGSFDSAGKPQGPRQQPYSTGVKLFMTEGSEAAFGGIVQVRVEPSEALVLLPEPGKAADERTCDLIDGAFQCIANEEGYASFVVAADGDWSGDASIIVTWADERKERVVRVLPAGLPDEATNFTLIAGGLDDTDRILATFVPLKCTIGPVPDDLGSKWREGEIRVRQAVVRATAPSGLPGVLENAPVVVESLHAEAELSIDKSCTAEDRQTRLRVLLNADGESPAFYLCFSDLGGNVELSVTSGQKIIEPNRQIQVDPEPRLLRVRNLKDFVEAGTPIDLFEISAYNANRVRIAMPVDIETTDEQVIPLTQASITLSSENDDPTVLQVLPAKPGTAQIHVTPRLLMSPDCTSQTVTVEPSF